MYAYRKAMPRANKHLEEKWVKHCQKLHKSRLRQMKPAIDNKPPAKYIHLEQNLKKQQMDEERYSQIERENYLLLDKMSHIMTHPQLLDEKYMGAPVTFGKSLNKEYRKRELMRITEENMQILRRIQSKEPHYSHLEWEEQARRDEEYLRNCAEYPVVLAGAGTTKPPSRRGSRRAPMYSRQEPSFTQPAPAPVQVRVRQAQRPMREEGYDDVGYGEDELGPGGADRGSLQSRGSAREQRGLPAMPKVEEEGGGEGAGDGAAAGGRGEEEGRAGRAGGAGGGEGEGGGVVESEASGDGGGGGEAAAGEEGAGKEEGEGGAGGARKASVAESEEGYEDDFEKTGQTMGSVEPTPRSEAAEAGEAGAVEAA